jgi:hypothetical protein
MKKLFSTSLFMMLFALAITATANEKDTAARTLRFTYCELTNTQKTVGTMTTVEADFGQKKVPLQDNRLKDKQTGKVITFHSIVDALNYMGEQGWELVQTYQEKVEDRVVHHWILKKRVE